MVCLHSLTSEAARRLSLPVISGVWQTSFEVAKSLVDDGEAAKEDSNPDPSPNSNPTPNPSRHPSQAAKEDFCVFAGYAGWGPTQLQGEVERDSWFLAAADSSVLLQELLQQAREVPTNRAGDGLRTWDTLMEGIGKAEQAGQSRGCLSDRTLGRWVDAHLYPPPAATDDEAGDEAEGEAGRVKGSLVGQLLRTRVASEDAASAADTADAAVGAVLEDQFRKALSSLAADGTYTVGLGADVRGPPMARTRAPEYALSEQFLHKALLLVVLDTSESGQQPLLPEQPAMCVAVVLNRPTANVVQVHTDNKPRRHITFGGEARLRGGVAGLDVDSNGLLWLHHRDGISGGTEVGDSGVYRMPGNDAAALVKAGEATLEDFLVVAGVVAMPRDELLSRMDCGDMQTVTGGAVLYPQLWALTDATDGARAEEQIPLELSDGTALWWAATQLGGGGAAAGEAAELTMPSLPASELADDTLAEWLKFFAGHQGREDE